MRMRRKPNLAQRYEKCTQFLVTNPAAMKGLWLENTGLCKLHLELGCGKGQFTAETARLNPDVFIAALEKSADAMVIAAERAADEGLSNIRFINAFADDLVKYFEKGEVLRIYINFCDPWPARRHEKRRLTSPGFLEIYKQILKPGAQIHFKTDSTALFEYSLREFTKAGFELSEVTRNLHENGQNGVMTNYESKFHAQGIPINRCVASLTG